MSLARSLLVAGAVSSLAACGKIIGEDFGYDELSASGGHAGAGGTGAGAGGAGGTAGGGTGLDFWYTSRPDGCISAGAPTPAMRPVASDKTALPPIYLAIDHLRLGGEDPMGTSSPTAWQDIGFDLDGTCTDSGAQGNPAGDACSMVEEQSCKPTIAKLPPDGTNCRDNTLGRFEGDVAHTSELAKYRLDEDLFNCGLCVGYYTFVIKISDYNGTVSDDQVRVDLYPSPGIEKPYGLDCTTPSWKSGDLCWVDDPSNRWKIDADSLAASQTGSDLPSAKLADANAYVRDGYLVMQLPDPASLWFPTQPGVPMNSFPILLHGGVLVAKVQKTNGAWTLTSGTIAGRSLEKEMVSGFRNVGFCEVDPLYNLMTSQVHAALDITAPGTTDPSTTCDAISVGVGFTARGATPGPTEKVVPLVECTDRFTGM